MANTGEPTILTIDYKRLPRLFYFSLGALCSLLVATLIFEHRVSLISAQHNQNYGLALARMAAQQGVDATLNHDLVSLQVILQDVATNPGVLLATIHDVENNLLVQAGNAALARTTELPLSSHTAPITLHDSVAGYVTVTVSETNLSRAPLLTAVVAIAFLLAAIGGLSLYDSRSVVFARRTQSASPASPETGESSEKDDVVEDVPPTEPGLVMARLTVANMRSLRQQLTATLVHSTQEKLDEVLEKVLSLYSGRLDRVDEEERSYLLIFESPEGDAEAAFHAVCSVYLAVRLAAQLSPMRVDLKAYISNRDAAAMIDESPTEEPVAVGRAVAETDLLKQRLVLESPETHPDQYVLRGFHKPFGALLERQYDQLRSLMP